MCLGASWEGGGANNLTSVVFANQRQTNGEEVVCSGEELSRDGEGQQRKMSTTYGSVLTLESKTLAHREGD